MNRLFLLASLAVLTACSPPDDRTPPIPEPSLPATPAAPRLQPVGSLAGEYRVAGINEASLDASIGLALSITDRVILFDGPCGRAAWDYELEGIRIRTVRVNYPDPDCLGSRRAYNLVIALASAVDAVEFAGRTESNGIELSGGERSVTLYSQ
jgi:hypothetical protein